MLSVSIGTHRLWGRWTVQSKQRLLLCTLFELIIHPHPSTTSSSITSQTAAGRHLTVTASFRKPLLSQRHHTFLKGVVHVAFDKKTQACQLSTEKEDIYLILHCWLWPSFWRRPTLSWYHYSTHTLTVLWGHIAQGYHERCVHTQTLQQQTLDNR